MIIVYFKLNFSVNFLLKLANQDVMIVHPDFLIVLLEVVLVNLVHLDILLRNKLALKGFPVVHVIQVFCF